MRYTKPVYICHIFDCNSWSNVCYVKTCTIFGLICHAGNYISYLKYVYDLTS